MTGAAIPAKDLESYISDARGEFESVLADLVQIPTVSSDPERAKDVRRGAEAAAQVLRGFGADAQVVETAGHPVVWGKMDSSPSHPTLIVYNHMDVQPAQEPEWVRDPFTFAIEGDRYLGRGCTDDKGPALTALFAARYAQQQGTPLNIQFVWELEEEVGSPNFADFIQSNREGLTTDSVLVSDTVWLSRDVPAIPYGLRGMQGARLLLETAEKDAHSGLTGGAARNPIGELCKLIAELYDAKTGAVSIPGFYGAVEPVADDELENFLASGFDLDKFTGAHGLTTMRTRDVAEVVKRIWCEPTFEVHGISGGYTGPGIKTVVPPRGEAKVSMRLVPNQDPDDVMDLLRRRVKELNPDVTVEDGGSLKPYLGQFQGPYSDAARDAISHGFGKSPAFIREGGSIGAVVTMQEQLDAPITFIGLSLPEHSYHGPNEHFDWGQASGGIRALVRYFEIVSQIPKDGTGGRREA